jgi:hypothetical protein
MPASVFIDHDSAFVREAGIPSKVSIHGTVAAALTLKHEDEERWYKSWQDVWPTMEDFEMGMPLCWNEEARGLLTPAAEGIYVL